MMRLAWVKLCLFYGLNRMIVTYDIVMNFSHNDVVALLWHNDIVLLQ